MKNKKIILLGLALSVGSLSHAGWWETLTSQEVVYTTGIILVSTACLIGLVVNKAAKAFEDSAEVNPSDSETEGAGQGEVVTRSPADMLLEEKYLGAITASKQFYTDRGVPQTTEPLYRTNRKAFDYFKD